ncbi:MAG: flagellar hook-length control protein FliK, partial [Gammaproteobacteria bacterium]|nr:flagellar hook-length control protein FliK [Gammaproteobacteria bacterium]
LADTSKAAGTAADAGGGAPAPVAAADTSGEAAVAPRGTRSISDRTTSRLGVDDPTSQQRVRALGIEPDATRATGESLFGRSAAHAGSGAGAGNGSNGSAGNGLQAQAAAAQRLAAQDDRQPAATGAAPIGGAAVVPDSTALQVATAMEAMPRRIEGAKADAPSIRGAEPGSVSAAPSASPFMLPVDAAAAGASASHLEMAQRMVEQVSWWLSQKTQGAELKLEVMGGHRVSVSVQVQGNEAQVAFRSDHPETRHMLQQAMPQLKELLGNEGLMLANSSVGGEAQGAGQPSDGQGARQFQGREGGSDAAPGAAEAPKPAHRVQSSRALDMYV